MLEEVSPTIPVATQNDSADFKPLTDKKKTEEGLEKYSRLIEKHPSLGTYTFPAVEGKWEEETVQPIAIWRNKKDGSIVGIQVQPRVFAARFTIARAAYEAKGSSLWERTEEYFAGMQACLLGEQGTGGAVVSHPKAGIETITSVFNLPKEVSSKRDPIASITHTVASDIDTRHKAVPKIEVVGDYLQKKIYGGENFVQGPSILMDQYGPPPHWQEDYGNPRVQTMWYTAGNVAPLSIEIHGSKSSYKEAVEAIDRMLVKHQGIRLRVLKKWIASYRDGKAIEKALEKTLHDFKKISLSDSPGINPSKIDRRHSLTDLSQGNSSSLSTRPKRSSSLSDKSKRPLEMEGSAFSSLIPKKSPSRNLNRVR